MNQIYKVYLSNDSEKENKMLKYIILGFKIGNKIDNIHTHIDVLSINKISRQVQFEAHRFTGLLRFIEIGSLLYAGLEPDHNILPLLAQHFVDRMKNEDFLIHDTKRNIAVAYNKKEWILSDYKLKDNIIISSNEKYFRKLWQGYFKHISIKSRENKRLQQQFVPKKYRKYLTEFLVQN